MPIADYTRSKAKAGGWSGAGTVSLGSLIDDPIEARIMGIPDDREDPLRLLDQCVATIKDQKERMIQYDQVHRYDMDHLENFHNRIQNSLSDQIEHQNSIINNQDKDLLLLNHKLKYLKSKSSSIFQVVRHDDEHKLHYLKRKISSLFENIT